MTVTEQVLNAKLEAVEARTETKFAQLLGRMDVMVEKLGALAADIGEVKTSIKAVDSKTNNTRVIIVTTAIGTVVGIVGLLYALVGYGNMVADSVTAEYSLRVEATKLNAKLDQILEIVDAPKQKETDQ